MKRLFAGAAIFSVVLLFGRNWFHARPPRNPLAYPPRVAIPSDLPALKLGYENNKDEENVPVWALCHPLYLQGHFCGWQRCLLDAAAPSTILDPKPWLRKELYTGYGHQSIGIARPVLFADARGIEDGYRACAALIARERERLDATTFQETLRKAQRPCGSCGPLCKPPLDDRPIPELGERI